jgi:hypothetical protein
MTLEFDGTVYTTVEDVKSRFRVAEKTIRKLIADGSVPKPEFITIGTRKFRHFPPEWVTAFEQYLTARNNTVV